jgi:hypothetical protein
LHGYVFGRLVNAGWGADLGYPALILDPKAQRYRLTSSSHSTFPRTGHALTTSKVLVINAS